jgi:hypothetical protein
MSLFTFTIIVFVAIAGITILAQIVANDIYKKEYKIYDKEQKDKIS